MQHTCDAMEKSEGLGTSECKKQSKRQKKAELKFILEDVQRRVCMHNDESSRADEKK